MRIHVIVNTTAKLHAERPRLVDRMRAVAHGRAALHRTANVRELAAVSSTLAREGADLVILSGGDGSFMAGTTELVRAFGEAKLPRIALLPGGTVATVARNWGRTGNPAELLEELLARPERLAFTTRPTLRVRSTARGITEERIGFIFGTGLVAKFFEVYYADGAKGYAGAARIVARIFAESFYGGDFARRVLDPLPCSVEVEGNRLDPEAWSLICASVVPNLGIHMLVTYRAGEDAFRPHLVASALTSGQLGPRAPLVLAGKRIGGPGHFDDLVREFTVSFPKPAPTNGVGHEGGKSRAESPMGPFVLDGDMLTCSTVHVSAGPRIRVAV